MDNKQVDKAIIEEIMGRLEKGETLQQIVGVSDETLEEIYTLAHGYYTRGQYEESTNLFLLLVGSAPRVYKYVLGLAASHHQQKSYENAAAGFFLALHLEPENPIPAYYITDCLLKQNFFEEAEECVGLTIDICADRPEYRALKEKCLLINQTIKSKKLNK